MNPQELTYRAELAVVNMRVGRNEEALNVLAEAEKIDPSYSEIYRLKGLTLVQMKRNTAYLDVKETATAGTMTM